MSIRGSVRISKASEGDWTQEVLPGFEPILASGVDVEIGPKMVRLRKTRERRKIEVRPQPGRGEQESP